MPNFKYAAKSADGRTVRGSVGGPTRAEALAVLRGQNLTVLDMYEAAKQPALALFAKGAPRPRVSTDDLVVFTRQLSTMISAGIPLLEALEIMEEQVTDKGFKFAIGRIVESVRSGSDFSQALGHYSRIFGGIYINMVKAGEVSGQLDTILVRLAEYMEAAAALKREIRAAMTYPLVSLTMIFGITLFLMLVILPKFREIFEAMEVELPLITQFVLGVSMFVRTKFWIWATGLAALVAAVYFYKKSDMGAYQFDWMVLRIPIIGQLFQKVALSRFSRTFATLIGSGVPILGALEIVSGTAGNRIVSQAVDKARESVRQGETLAAPLSESPVFPPMVTRMIAVGEKSGALESLLEKISQFYDQQVSAMVQSLTSLIEPILIGVMGVMVGGMVLSVFLPLFKLIGTLGQESGGS